MSKYIPWYLIGKWRIKAADDLLHDSVGDNNSDERVHDALKTGANPNYHPDPNKIRIQYLHTAFFKGNSKTVKLLIEHGADLEEGNMRDAYQYLDDDEYSGMGEAAKFIAEEAKKTGLFKKVGIIIKQEEKAREEKLKQEEKERKEKLKQEAKALEEQKIQQKIKLEEKRKHLTTKEKGNLGHSETTHCDFCNTTVSDPDAKVGIIKGASFLAKFEEVIGKQPQNKASHQDPKDGELLYYACQMCLLEYEGFCTRCGTSDESETLTKVILRGNETGKETPALLCTKCFTNFMTQGVSFDGFR